MKFSVVFLMAVGLIGATSVNAGPVQKSSELNDVLEEFLALVPKDKVVAIFLEYLEKDAEVQTIVEYVQSDGFKNLVAKVEKIEDVVNFYAYLHEAGLDIYTALNKLHEVIGLPPLVPGRLAKDIRITGGTAGLIEDIKAILPINDIKALYDEKLKSSPAFAQLIEHFKSPKFQQLIDALRANEEFKKMLEFAKEHGVDVKAIMDLLASLFGIKFPNSRANRAEPSRINDEPNELAEVLQEFVDLIPTFKIGKIVLEYEEDDAEVQDALEYIHSDEFENLVKEVESINDVMNLFEYLNESDLDFYEVLNYVHRAVGLPPPEPREFATDVQITGGIDGLFADIKAVLPIDKINSLHKEKLQTSSAFVRFVEHFKTPRFLELINALRMNAQFQVNLKIVNEAGIDTRAIIDLLQTMLGFNYN